MDAWCVEVAVRPHLKDADAVNVQERLAARRLRCKGAVLAIRGFLLPGELDEAAVGRAAAELLADPVSDRFVIARPGLTPGESQRLWSGYEEAARLTIRRRPGVMDPVARSVQEALADLGIPVRAAGTYKSFLVCTEDRAGLAAAGRMLANDVIEEVLVDRLPPGLPLPGGRSREARVEIPLANLDEAALLRLSNERCFSLNATEMRTVQGHFAKLGRAPTLTELETLAQTWSEHCKHKTLTGRIVVEGGRTYENLLKETVFRTTQDIDHWMCVSVFEDNAGVIDFDGTDCLCIKVETHNHPSAIEPFGGAGTGIGGVIRDVLGTGRGAKPLCNLDVFCVAPPDMAPSDVPPGCLHPARVLAGVVAGVRDYGNPMGIPTVTGAVHFDPAFVGNPLVYCGTIGMLPKSKVQKAARPGDRILVAGGRTGRDGIHGATFSSVELHEESETVSSGAVQIGDPITEKKVLDGLLEARDLDLYHAVTDCGAGGLSSAVGEMGEKLGAGVELARVPLKYEGLTPTEIWISEAQERMVFAVPPDKVAAFRRVFERYEVETTDIGEFTGSGRLELFFAEEKIADLEMDFLHHGVPRPTRKARWTAPTLVEPELAPPTDLGRDVLAALGDLAVCSKEWIVRQYDHEVQGCAVAKPFAGRAQKGPGDAAVLRPNPTGRQGFAVATGLNPRYSWIDPAAMAEAALDEAVRNVVARGGDPTRCAVLDNYCWGNTDKPEQLGALVRATEALCELARAYRTPFVSGKDSLNNEFRVGDRTIAIPGCLLVSAMAIVPDIAHVPDSAFVGAGHPVYLLGRTWRELGGSVWYKLHGELGRSVPRARAREGIAMLRFLHETIAHGWVLAAHDPAEGGLAVAAAEMAFGGGFGLHLDLANIDIGEAMRDDEILFAESLGRMLVEVDPAHEPEFVAFLGHVEVAFRRVGETLNEPVYAAAGTDGSRLFSLPLAACEAAWREPLARGPLALVPAGGDT